MGKSTFIISLVLIHMVHIYINYLPKDWGSVGGRNVIGFYLGDILL